MSGFTRCVIGAMGGLAASVSKVLALDVEKLGHFVETGNTENMGALLATIYIVTPALMFLGGLIAWASNETNRLKLLAIGCAAPAMIAPWTAGKMDMPQVASLASGLVTPAYAQVQQVQQPSTYVTGLKALFGLETPAENRYWVVVGSKQNLAEAKAYADAINAANPALKAFVAEKRPGNDFYGIIVGGPEAYYPLKQAEALKQEALKVSIIPSDAYLSNYQTPLPRPEAQ